MTKPNTTTESEPASLVARWWTWMTSRPTSVTSLWGAVVWWEQRRFAYNVMLAAVGIPSILVFFWAIMSSHAVPDGEDAVEPMALIVAPFVANVAYTLGWLVEGLTFGHRRQPPLGPRLMRLGLLFSLVVLLLPAAFWVLALLLQMRS